MEFLADVACEFASSGVDGMAMEGGWTLVEEGRGLDSGVKPRQRLCRLTSDQIVQHAPRPGFVWGVPGPKK
eukprot:2327079-Rhodomonas_salina.3